MYELQLTELDYRGIPNDMKTVKQTNNPKEIEELEKYAKKFLEKATPADYGSNTFYLSFRIIQDQDVDIYNVRKQIRPQIEW